MDVTFYALQVPDKPGVLGEVAGYLEEAGVNIEAFAADSSGLRILTNKPDETRKVFEAHAITFEAVDVIEIELPNRPGALAGVAKALGAKGVNIVTSFGSGNGADGGRIFIRVDDVDAAWEALDGFA